MSDFECTGLSYFFSPLKRHSRQLTMIHMYQNSRIPCMYMTYTSFITIKMIFCRYFILFISEKLSVSFLGFYFSPCTKTSTHHPTSTQMYINSKMPCIYMPFASINTIIMIFRRYFILVMSDFECTGLSYFFFSTKKHSRPSYQYSDVPKFENEMYIHAI
jgi:hypothetical protein